MLFVVFLLVNKHEVDLFSKAAMIQDYFVSNYLKNFLSFNGKFPIYIKQRNRNVITSKFVENTQNITQIFKLILLFIINFVILLFTNEIFLSIFQRKVDLI